MNNTASPPLRFMSAAIGVVFALFVASPLINVGPVNVAAFLLLLASLLWLTQNPKLWWDFWRLRMPLLLLVICLTLIFLSSNYENNISGPLFATFSQSRWFILMVVAAPAVAVQVNMGVGRHIVVFTRVILLFFALIYAVDAALYLGLDSSVILEIFTEQRSDPLRPSWVFNPHPFSRTLIAGLLLLISGCVIGQPLPQRVAYAFGIFLLSMLLIIGAVRTAFAALFIICIASLIIYWGKRAALMFLSGALLAMAGFAFRDYLFGSSLYDQSLEYRLVLLQDGVHAFLDRPWLGGGYQASRTISWSPALQHFVNAQTLVTTNTHIQWLEMYVSYGTLGGTLFIVFWATTGSLAIRTYRQSLGQFKLLSSLLILNWLNLTVAGFTTVFRETEWTLWVTTILGALWLAHRQHNGLEESKPALAHDAGTK
jgi:O-antigen ligase